MAYNSRHKKKNKLAASFDDGDDFVYPTKKVGKGTRNRRRDANLIQDGLIEHQNLDIEGNPKDWYDDQPMDQEILDDYNEMVIEFNEAEKDFYDHLDDDYNDAVDEIYGSWDLED